MNKFLSAVDAISQKTGEWSSFFIFPMILAVVYEVTMRYVFESPTEWVFETALFLFAGMVILGGCYVHKEKAHIGMDVVYNRLPPRARAVLDMVTFFIFLAFVGVLLQQSTIMAVDAWVRQSRSDSPWGPPLYPVITTIPLGALLLLLQGVAKFVRDLRVVKRGQT